MYSIFRHTLEVLISLAKSFPGYFLPLKIKDDCKYKDSSPPRDVRLKLSPGSSGCGGSRASRTDGTSFWDMLLRLDSVTSTKKGKSVARAHSASALSTDLEGNVPAFEMSAFGQLLTMLASPVVKRSCLLTDKLLRLLSLISVGLPEVNPYVRRRDGNNTKKPEEKSESVPVSEQHLKLAIDVLTSKSCSEEGLEDATALLLNMANCPDPTRNMVNINVVII
jgi:E3 ubiquitin-protein ligase HUWE1